MTQQGSYPPTAADAYDAMAPIYDRFNEANDYEVWLGEALLPELEKHGLEVGRVLDVGCGTGRAFEPLRRRAWSYWGCDVSGEMLRVAKAQAGSRSGFAMGTLFEADARQLPDLPGSFELVLLLNDVVNYLTEDGDLEKCFSGVKRNLAEGGLVCFDANTLGYFESAFAPDHNGDTVELGSAPIRERGLKWTGLTGHPEPGGIFEAELVGDGIDGVSLHRERHWSPEQIKTAMSAAGLFCVAAMGQREDEGGSIHFDPEPDEQRHYKVVYIGGHRG